MKNFKNQSILIGRDPQKSQLIVAMTIDGKLKGVGVENTLTIPNSVSRCDTATKSAHCRIDIDGNGNMKITNLKDANVTYVDGTMVACKAITESSKIALGGDQYEIRLADIKKALLSLDESVDISHLEVVWNTYREDLEKISKVQQERNRRRMLPMLIGVASGCLAPILSNIKSVGDKSLYVTIPISVLSLIICLKNFMEKDTSIEDKKRAEDKFKKSYVCPKCGNVLQGEFLFVRQRGKCQYCSAPYKYDVK